MAQPCDAAVIPALVKAPIGQKYGRRYCNYKSISAILNAGKDKPSLANTPRSNPHEFVRGADYYKSQVSKTADKKLDILNLILKLLFSAM